MIKEFYENELKLIASEDDGLAEILKAELEDQRDTLKMIASENYCSPVVQACMGNWLTDKYAEGYPYHRFYGGCENIDLIEERGCEVACKLFGAEHANIQPHCGADANMQAYWAILTEKILKPDFEAIKTAYEIDGRKIPKTYSDIQEEDWNYIRRKLHNQKLMGMDYYAGGHLTHGYRQNTSAQLFDVCSYGVREDGLIDYDALEEYADCIRPLILLAGYSAYPRKINFAKMREIADSCGAVLMVDMAHFAGLVAGGVFTGEYNPIPYADIVTTTTHKTLRGPRGGMILCKQWLAEAVDKGCPMTMGGPLPHVMLAKTMALLEASKSSFRDYASQIVRNSQALAEELQKEGIKVCTGGTDNHIVLIDVSPLGLNGRQAEYSLCENGITCNRNALPNDPNGPWYTSGIRLGTPALTTRGFKEDDMKTIGWIIANILKHSEPVTLKDGKNSLNKAKISDDSVVVMGKMIFDLVQKHPLYPDIELRK